MADLPTSTAAPADDVPVRASAWFALGVLLLVYVLNFLDRTLIFVLFAPIKKEMAFTDLQLALLGSTSFVLFYTTLGIPFGRLADRVSRRKMIAAGLFVWSLFSGLTGFATDFWSIFACRVMVGVGEATLGPAAMSLLSDLFPARRRATVQSLFSAGIPLGAAAAFLLGGPIGGAYGWRAAFQWLGFPGIALALVVLALSEPARPTQVAGGTGPAGTGLLEDLRALLAIPALRWHVLGYATLAIASNSLSIWVPTLMARAHKVPLTDIGTLMGMAMLVSGGLATGMGGAVADLLRAKGVGGRLKFGAALALACAPLWATIALSGSLVAIQASFFLLAGLGLAWLGPAAADVHDLVPARLRGLGIAGYFFAVNVIGYGAAPPIVGAISDALGAKDDPTALATALLVSPLACLLAAGVLWRAARLREETAVATAAA